MKNDISQYITENKQLLMDILKELCHIPAPSHREHARAQYCQKLLEDWGAKGVYTDNAQNVIFPLGCEGKNGITVFAAHTDTVFPDTKPLPYHDDGKNIHCPGAGDNTASVAVLLMTAKYMLDSEKIPQNGIIFVFNSCEEGMGNLAGIKEFFSKYKDRVKNFITFDSRLDTAHDVCVGSHRYEVEVNTRGGHSFEDFGNINAISVLSSIISEIYNISVPEKDGTHTTYNVGTVIGGTSVNTIAQSAKMLCEYRSDDAECLEIMRKRFADIFDSAVSEDVAVAVTKVGDRPCGTTAPEKTETLKSMITPIIEGVLGKQLKYTSASTDCNIPMSLGIPSLCVGVCNYDGMHTREEWVEKDSLITGLEIALKTVEMFI